MYVTSFFHDINDLKSVYRISSAALKSLGLSLRVYDVDDGSMFESNTRRLLSVDLFFLRPLCAERTGYSEIRSKLGKRKCHCVDM